MKIISWNMNKRKEGSWSYLIEKIDPDYALLQESSPIFSDDLRKKTTEVKVKQNLRNSVYAKNNLIGKVKLSTDGGLGLNVTSVNEPTLGKIFFLSVYGNLDFWETLDLHLLGALSIFIYDLRKRHDAEHIVIAGDFNMDRRMDDNPTGTRFSKKGERRQNIFFDCILDLGFKDCIAETLEDYVQTHRHNLSKFPWQIDHFFASEKLFKGLTDLKVIDNEEVRNLSDHNPIIAEFDLSLVKQ